jgi:hypothetical protein
LSARLWWLCIRWLDTAQPNRSRLSGAACASRCRDTGAHLTLLADTATAPLLATTVSSDRDAAEALSVLSAL